MFQETYVAAGINSHRSVNNEISASKGIFLRRLGDISQLSIYDFFIGKATTVIFIFVENFLFVIISVEYSTFIAINCVKKNNFYYSCHKKY